MFEFFPLFFSSPQKKTWRRPGAVKREREQQQLLLLPAANHFSPSSSTPGASRILSRRPVGEDRSGKLILSSKSGLWNREGNRTKKVSCFVRRPAGIACFLPPRRRQPLATRSTPGTMSLLIRRAFPLAVVDCGKEGVLGVKKRAPMLIERSQGVAFSPAGTFVFLFVSNSLAFLLPLRTNAQ